jgi:hypothetical protein
LKTPNLTVALLFLLILKDPDLERRRENTLPVTQRLIRHGQIKKAECLLLREIETRSRDERKRAADPIGTLIRLQNKKAEEREREREREKGKAGEIPDLAFMPEISCVSRKAGGWSPCRQLPKGKGQRQRKQTGIRVSVPLLLPLPLPSSSSIFPCKKGQDFL